MAGDNIQSKNLEDYIKEARESTLSEFMKNHDESYFLVGQIPVVGDASKKLAYSTMPGGSIKDLEKKGSGPVVYEITFDRISSGQMVWIGRAGNCLVQIEHPSISKLQGYLKLDIKEKKLMYADMKSTNGSRVDNGPKLTPETEVPISSMHTLCFGEIIKMQFYSLPDFRDMLESLK